jgi:hypothetical protein
MRVHKTDLMEKVFAISANLKLSKWPLFLAYQPRSFALKGSHTREVMKKVQFGDVLVRSYNGYLDGLFVPGTFSHVGFYLGPVTEAHLKQFAKIDHAVQFNTGEQMVIHAIGDKVYVAHLIDFCRCDGLAIMRFPRQIKGASKQPIPERLQAYFKDPLKPPVPESTETTADEESEKPKKAKKAKSKKEEVAAEPVTLDADTLALIKAESNIAQHLAQGNAIEFEKVFKVLYRVALRELTMPSSYDFEFDSFYGTSSTELVYFITKSIGWLYGIEPETHKVFFKPRRVILPDLFVDCGLEEIWKEVL